VSLELKGQRGLVYWGYHRVGALTEWALIRGESGQWVLTGTIGPDWVAFRASQAPLTFHMPYTARGQPAEWVWPIMSLHYVGNHFSATLGPREREVSDVVASGATETRPAGDFER
jgi:hypothetical protein